METQTQQQNLLVGRIDGLWLAASANFFLVARALCDHEINVPWRACGGRGRASLSVWEEVVSEGRRVWRGKKEERGEARVRGRENFFFFSFSPRHFVPQRSSFETTTTTSSLTFSWAPCQPTRLALFFLFFASLPISSREEGRKRAQEKSSPTPPAPHPCWRRFASPFLQRQGRGAAFRASISLEPTKKKKKSRKSRRKAPPAPPTHNAKGDVLRRSGGLAAPERQPRVGREHSCSTRGG